MNHITQWLADLARLPQIDIDQWQTFQHAYEYQTCSAAALPAVLRDLGEVSGWISETGRVVTLRQTRIELETLPLAGEFYQGDLCWQLSHHPRDQWQLHRHHLTACAADQATHLGERVEHLLAGSRTGRLGYWRLWGLDPQTTGPDRLPQCRIALLTDIQDSRA